MHFRKFNSLGGFRLDNEARLKSAYSAPNILADLKYDSRSRSGRRLPPTQQLDNPQSPVRAPSLSYSLDEVEFTGRGTTTLPRLENELLERLIQSQIQCDRLASKLKSQQRFGYQDIIDNNINNNNSVNYNLINRSQQLSNINNRLNGSETDLNLRSGNPMITRPYNGVGSMQVDNNVQSHVYPTQQQLQQQPQPQYPQQQSNLMDLESYSETSVDISKPADTVVEPVMKNFSSGHPATKLQNWLSPLVARYNDLFTTLRVKTMERLQSFGQSDYERSQRLIFHAVQAGFTVTRQIVRRLHSFPTNRQQYQQQFSQPLGSIYDSRLPTDSPLKAEQLDSMVTATLRRLMRHPPPDCACRTLNRDTGASHARAAVAFRKPIANQELNALKELVREVCCLAWYLLKERTIATEQADTNLNGDPMMSSRSWHVDVDRAAKPGDTYDDTCYRRCYDSEPSSGQVHHYIWPCLILFSRSLDLGSQVYDAYPPTISTNQKQGVRACVLVKGEACTRNPKTSATQRDKAAALLNHEYYRPRQDMRTTSPCFYTQNGGFGSSRPRSISSRRV